MRQAGMVAYLSMTAAERKRTGRLVTTAQAAMLAVGEARAVLAETEPRWCGPNGPYGRWPAAERALAESLAAVLPVLDELEAASRA